MDRSKAHLGRYRLKLRIFTKSTVEVNTEVVIGMFLFRDVYKRVEELLLRSELIQ